ncbi:hypothetical protein D6C81_08398, partial [Aureobasidium pullulans]
WWDEHKWEKLSDKEFCKIDKTPLPAQLRACGGSMASSLACVTGTDSQWASWMDEKRGGHNIGQKGGQGKMYKRRPYIII